jgi:dUTP pyrophosphatase
MIKIKLDDPKLAPYRAHASDAGADLFSKETHCIYPDDQVMVDTGVSIKIPVGYVGLVFNRSSQGKLRVQIANGTGVIDAGYRGNIKVLLINNGLNPYNIIKYETRIAQIVIIPVVLEPFEKWDVSQELWDDTERGTGGFGSTGT